MELFDSHCHLIFPEFHPDRVQVIENCEKSGLSGICIPATRSAEWDSLLDVKSTSRLQQYVALGLHPCFLNQHQKHDIDHLDHLLSQKPHRLVAVGETGLDFYDRAMPESDRNLQTTLFIQHVRLARKHQLPLIIHARKSHDQILRVLRQLKPDAGGIIHAFSGSEQQARQYCNLGFKLGFGGGITYPRAKKTRQLAASLPIDTIVLETDAPDMPLFGFQGQRNSPEQLPLIAQCLGKLRHTEASKVAEITTSNCRQLFSI